MFTVFALVMVWYDNYGMMVFFKIVVFLGGIIGVGES